MRILGLPIVLIASSAWGQLPVSTSQYDAARTGANLAEKTLTPQNVNARQFGKLLSFPVDGDVYAQPLYLPAVNVPGKGVHDVVFVATEHDSVYAFDSRGQPREPLWHVSFGNSGAAPVPAREVDCPFISPEVGITSTPVIDTNTGTLYVLARTKEPDGFFSSRYLQKLHALAVTTGAEKFGGPSVIAASVAGSKGPVAFDPLRENPRAALLLANGRVYLSWASSCDVEPYHGWVMAYDARTLKQAAVFNTSPDDRESGIWMSDTGPAADQDGNVFVVTGNGLFSAAFGGRDYGDTVLKLRLDGPRFELADYFTPFNQGELNANDDDLGSGGPVLLPDQPGPHRRLLLAGGKGGSLYVIDRDRMGKYRTGSDLHAVDVVRLHTSLFGAPAYWNGRVYVVGASDAVRSFGLDNGHLIAAARSTGPAYPDGGATPAISADGANNAIVWVIETKGWRGDRKPAVLHAYDALDLRELYNSARENAAVALRFTIPTVAAGRVFVGATHELAVYGLIGK
jgi:hypothetical protein